jgi:hypothetical protein
MRKLPRILALLLATASYFMIRVTLDITLQVIIGSVGAVIVCLLLLLDWVLNKGA